MLLRNNNDDMCYMSASLGDMAQEQQQHHSQTLTWKQQGVSNSMDPNDFAGLQGNQFLSSENRLTRLVSQQSETYSIGGVSEASNRGLNN